MNLTKRLQQLAGIYETDQSSNIEEMAAPASKPPFAVWEITTPGGLVLTLASGKAATDEDIVVKQYKSRIMQRVSKTLVLTRDSERVLGGNTKSETYMSIITAAIKSGLANVSARRRAFSPTDCQEVYQVGMNLLQNGTYLNRKINSCATIGQPERDLEI